MPNAIDPTDILGNRYGKLVVKEYAGIEYKCRNRNHLYICECDCGSKNIKTTRSMLIKGDKISCGCAHKDAGERVKEDLTGQKFGRWAVLGPAPTKVSPSGKTRRVMWKCQCECGTIKEVGARALKTGMSQSCGCLQKERVSDAMTDDLTGKRFCNLTVIKRDGSHIGKYNAYAKWLCKCDCGNEISVLGMSLKNGDTTSCGCKKESKYEMYVQQYLESCEYVLKKDFWREKTFKNLVGISGQRLRYDFYIRLRTGEKLFIECQGEQHYRPFEWYGGVEYFNKLKEHDHRKKEYAENHDMRLIEVPYKLVSYEEIEKFLKENFVY